MLGLTWMVLVAGFALAPTPQWRLVEAYTASCPSLDAYYLDDYSTTGDGVADIRLMGRLLLGGGRAPARAGLVMENGRASWVIVQADQDGSTVEITALEFWGRWKSPCDLLDRFRRHDG